MVDFIFDFIKPDLQQWFWGLNLATLAVSCQQTHIRECLHALDQKVLFLVFLILILFQCAAHISKLCLCF